MARALADLDAVRAHTRHVQRAHDDYLARLRPEVIHDSGSSLVQAENALGLFTVLIGSSVVGRDEAGLARRNAATDQADDYPVLRWSFGQAPDIDNGPVLIRDRTYREQIERASHLRQRLDLAFAAEREGFGPRWTTSPAEATADPPTGSEGPEVRPLS